MLREENDLLSRVGLGTPMGNLMRQYWIPALVATELSEPDSPPLRVRLLGEDLIAFRTASGNVGLIQHACMHRGASLFFGRNEADGIRCVYHGWKYGVTGQCVDMPNEPAESNFKDKIKATAYPCVERSGVIWTYMGPRQTPPPLPDLEPNMLAEGEYFVGVTLRECNWLQALEGDIDTSHLGFLHMGALKPERATPGSFEYYIVADRAPRYNVVDTAFGTSYGGYRPAEADTSYWRIAHFLFPFYTMIPTGTLGVQIFVRAWIPVDDEHTMVWVITAPRSRQPSNVTGTTPAGGAQAAGVGGSQAAGVPSGGGNELLPPTSDWLGRFRLKQNKQNDYLIDREAQRSGRSYTGLASVNLEDQAITESMGPIWDRTKEHLGSSDAMVIRTRRRLLQAAEALRDQGVLPPGVDDPSIYRVRSGGVVLPKGVDGLEATKELQKAPA